MALGLAAPSPTRRSRPTCSSFPRKPPSRKEIALDGKRRRLIDRLILSQTQKIRHGIIRRRGAKVRQGHAERGDAGVQVNRRTQFGVRGNEGLDRVEPLCGPLPVINRNLAVRPAIGSAHHGFALPRGFQTMLRQGSISKLTGRRPRGMPSRPAKTRAPGKPSEGSIR